MREIYVIDDNGTYTLHWLMALLWAHKEFKEKGYEIKFHNSKSLIARRLLAKPILMEDFDKIIK